MQEKFYLTTAIDYVNGKPHIGHAYEKILSDVIIRHKRQLTDKAYMLTGTDEHGVKIQKTAAAKGISPIELCDENFSGFEKAWKELEISYDQIIRTTDEKHKKTVKKIFKKLLENGDIYKHSYTGLYCAGCESFLNAKDLTQDGLCPDHLKKPEEITEENYFFKLTKYKDKIAEYIKSHPDFIKPSIRVNEILNQLENIEDISVSRTKSSVQWGIEVPNDDTQTIYVWIDALSNYITAIGYDSEEPSEQFKELWPADVHVIGKDIIKFHSIYWIAILMSLGLPLPKSIFAHGWITIDQSKMSKSLGNVIAPHDVLTAFNLEKPDAFRYYMASAALSGKDGNYSDEDFKEKVNADLANNIGNLLNRTLNMLVKYFDGELKSDFISDENSKAAILASNTKTQVIECFNRFEVAEAANLIVSFADNINKYVTDSAPWTLAKEGKMLECGRVLYNVLEAMRHIAIMIYPYCPNIAENILTQLNEKADFKYTNLYWGGLKNGKITEKDKIKPVFLRLDSEFATDKKKG
ncbi:MAG: methionine--tRNA ligase [Candidatus Gastranaerophilales bacterium]|nr:methionine--tRNA ligase [Candidatus Gastranaerophilales bacterium]